MSIQLNDHFEGCWTVLYSSYFACIQNVTMTKNSRVQLNSTQNTSIYITAVVTDCVSLSYHMSICSSTLFVKRSSPFTVTMHVKGNKIESLKIVKDFIIHISQRSFHSQYAQKLITLSVNMWACQCCCKTNLEKFKPTLNTKAKICFLFIQSELKYMRHVMLCFLWWFLQKPRGGKQM